MLQSLSYEQLRVIDRTVNRLSSWVDWALLGIMVAVLVFAGYALWDEEQIIAQAQSINFQVYKPTEDDSLSFEELRAINPDVFAWIQIYGTQISYPVLQTDNNRKYLNTDVFGNHSLAGSIFLDQANDPNFTDFNSVIHGHHMVGGAMFGNIDLFVEKEFFDTRLYGNLFYNGRDHGVEIFAFLERSTYDWYVFKPAITDVLEQQRYLDTIRADATHVRDIGATIDDRILLLGTCSPHSTQGRYILVGRITDEVFANPFPDPYDEFGDGGGLGTHIRWLIPVLCVIALVFLWLWWLFKRKAWSEDE